MVRSTGSPATAIAATSTLFGSPTIGNLALTNMETPGQLASDQTYVALALRVYLYFDGTNRRALYLQTSSQLFCTFWLGRKPQFTHPSWYAPSGGGVWGQTGDTNSFYNLGVPSQEAILKLARPIIIPVRQNISVDMTFFTVGTTNVLNILNSAATDDQMVIKYMIDGLVTRDVQ